MGTSVTALPSVASLVPAGVVAGVSPSAPSASVAAARSWFAVLAPAAQPASVRASVARCLALAVARELAVFSLPAGSAVGLGAPASAPCWAVSSASAPGRAHLVWLSSSGRLACSCPARLSARVCCCSHAAAVRLVLLAGSGRLVGASVPAFLAASASAPSVEPEPEPEPPSGGPGAGGGAPVPVCPGCGGVADPRELEELGACLSCIAGRAGVHLARCACGAIADGETVDGPICERCEHARKERWLWKRLDLEAKTARGAEDAKHEAWNRREERNRATRATDPRNRGALVD